MNQNSTTNSAPCAKHRNLLSLIITVYNGGNYLDSTIERILDMKKSIPDVDMEIIAVDDASEDNSFAVILQNQKRYPDIIRAVRLAKNCGPMITAQAGIECARGDCIAVLPQDLQDPPESIPEMFAAWKNGDKINMTYRITRSEPLIKKGLAAVYHFFFRTLTGINYPHGGLGIFLIDRQIAEEIKKSPQNHIDILLWIFSMGYPVHLHPAPRLPPKDKSNWTFSKSVKLVIDNLIGFSYLPVRLMSFLGVVVALASFSFASYVFIGKISGWYVIAQPPGWATIVVLLSMLLGMVMIMLGVIGEYLWRILDSVRGEPLYRIAENLDIKSPSESSKDYSDKKDVSA